MGKARPRLRRLVDELARTHPHLDDPEARICAGEVTVDGIVRTNPASLVRLGAAVALRLETPLRGERKLDAALAAFVAARCARRQSRAHESRRRGARPRSRDCRRRDDRRLLSRACECGAATRVRRAGAGRRPGGACETAVRASARASARGRVTASRGSRAGAERHRRRTLASATQHRIAVTRRRRRRRIPRPCES